MLLDFQSSAFDRSAICPRPDAPDPGDARGANHSNVVSYLDSGLAASAGLAGAVLELVKGGGMSRQGSSLPRTRSGVVKGGTLRALRVLGASRPGGAVSGGSSAAPA